MISWHQSRRDPRLDEPMYRYMTADPGSATRGSADWDTESLENHEEAIKWWIHSEPENWRPKRIGYAHSVRLN